MALKDYNKAFRYGKKEYESRASCRAEADFGIFGRSITR